MVACFIFSCCSASLLLLNKVIMHFLPMPSFVSTLQFASSTIVAMWIMLQGLAPTDKFEWRKVKPYILYVAMFVTTIYCNFKALQFSNVETLIVARACVPCVVSILDFACLGRKLPALRSWASMFVMVMGATGYVLSDAAFQLDGFGAYSWVMLYFVVISLEMAYAKHIVGPQLGFSSMWGPTLYTNTISIPPMAFIGLVSGEQEELWRVNCTALGTGEPAQPFVGVQDGPSFGLVVLVIMSCIVGVAISYFGFKARSLVSATCFTVLGVANKMATVTANVMIWDQHASPIGIFCLVVCLLGAASYQQAPMREQTRELLDSDKRSETHTGIVEPANEISFDEKPQETK